MITTSAHRSYLPLVILICLISVSLIAPTLAGAQDPGRREAAAPVAGKSGTQLVSIDFNNVDIGVFIKFISDLTNRNFIVDDKVRGKVTIISPGKITVSEAYKVFESVLEVYGFATVRAGEITKIVPSPEARTKNIKTRLEEESGLSGDAVITQLIPLRYADPNEIKTLFTPLISKNSMIQAYGPTNTLIVTDVSSNIRRLLNILKAIDITGVGQQIAIIPVENGSASKLVTLLQTVFQTSPRGGKGRRPQQGKDITFVADERTNAIVVMASEGDVDNIRQLVKNLDIETPRGQGNINVYYLEHATAEDVAKVLMDIPQKGADGKAQEGKRQAPVVSSKVRIAADKATNSLIIMAETDEYLVLESIIKKIDIPRAMVYIEALIMEVNVQKNFQLGVQWQMGSQTSYDGKEMIYGGGFKPNSALYTDPTETASGLGVDTSSIPIVPKLNPGFSMGIFGEMLEIGGIQFPSIAAVINAYKTDSDVRILSTPQILTTDNQEAKIYVGKNIPFQTTTSTSTAIAGDVYNSFEYKDVGKTLKITPQISKDRLVRLTLSLEITAVEGTPTAQPTTLKRTIDSTVIVMDGNTVVLGGLIGDQEDNSHYKTPCLGDIPGIGLLFRSSGSSVDKTNLYIFLTPRVLKSPIESSDVSIKKRDEIESTTEQNINLYKRKIEPPPLEDLRMPAPQLETAPEPESAVPAGLASATGDDTAPTETNRSFASDVDATQVSGTEDADAMVDLAAYEGASESSGEVQGYTLQVASVKLADKANTLLAELTGKGFAAYVVRSEVNGTIWYRVRIGYFADKNSTGPVMDQLNADQYSPILIKL